MIIMRSFSLWLMGLIVAIVGFFAFWQETAAAPPRQAADDLACILCHQDTTAVITFPSGETIPAQIDLDTLAHSAHGSGDETLTCTDCHNPNEYRAPHAGVTTPDYESYQLEQSATCERCHIAPHLNSHPQEDLETAVSCIDCHGGHEMQTAVSPQTCAACHTETGAKTTKPADLKALIENGLFAQKVGEAYCLACHSQPNLTMTFANGDVKSVTIDTEALHNSVHGDNNSWQPLDCANCHEMDAYPHKPVEAQSARAYSLERYAVCEQCHDHNYEQVLDSVHGAALADGKLEAAICTDCHGSHDTPSPNEPRERISHICEQCHSEIFNEYAGSVHGEALLENGNRNGDVGNRNGDVGNGNGDIGNKDVPVCIDCHGVHNINSPTTALARARSPELCADCHADTALMDKYEISTDVFETYVADFHGETVVLFENDDPTTETNKAVCYDCHGVHNILPPDAPHAGIKDNLLITCQQCHPDATDNFSDAWTSHFRPSLEHNPLVYLVNLFYKIVIPLTMGFFIFMICTDLYRRIRQARGKQ